MKLATFNVNVINGLLSLLLRPARVFAVDPAFADWRSARTQRIQGGFYTSQALELARG